MSDVSTLLADYSQRGSERAFCELVARYTDLVYSTALRLVEGDAHGAQDIAQTVFLDLARKAGHLSREVSLGDWLHRHTCFVAATAMRGQRRREARERIAAAMNAPDHTAADFAALAPVLDEAINQLPAEDRAAIMLRYFEQLDFRAVGARLDASDDAARMRVNRALEKLHGILKTQGVSFSLAALGTALAAESVKAAPAGLAASFAAHALAGVVSGAAAATKVLALAKLKFALAAVVAVALLAAPLAIQHRNIQHARDENQQLRQQLEQFTSLQADNDRLNAQLSSNHALALSESQTHELARLRSEVGLLRDKTNELVRALNRSSNPLIIGALFHGKRVLRGITMDQFAQFLSEVLNAPVRNETGLSSLYDIAITPPRVGPPDQLSDLVPRVTRILKDELGMDLIQATSAFLGTGENTPEGFSVRASARPDDPNRPVTQVVSYSLRLNSPGAAGIKSASDDPDPFGLANADLVQNNSPDAQSVADPSGVLGPGDPAAQNACINNLRLIDAAKQQWALEKSASPTNVPAWDDIAPYLSRGPNGDLPKCPSGGTYVIGRVLDRPTCSVAGHVMP